MYLLRTPLRQRSKMLKTYKTHEIILASLGACSELVAALCHGSCSRFHVGVGTAQYLVFLRAVF